MKPRIYNRDLELVGILENASKVSYSRTYNNLHTASLELPADDPKTALCDTHYIVDIFDGEESKGKFRILDEPDSDITSNGEFVRYSCEHVIATLLNDVIDGYLEIGGTNFTTRQVIEHILSLQTVKRWRLGECDFNYQFQYSWENTNLLDALFSVPACFADSYHWTYDTDMYPWTINLLAQDTDRSCEIRRKRNMCSIKRAKDSSMLCTRLYCKGNGEGVNQVGISEVNPTGKPYIDADTIDTYGVLAAHFIDLSVTDAETLYARGQAMLEEMKHPRYTYTAKAIDLEKITGLEWDKFDEGKYVHIIDEEKRLDLDAMIISVEKSDVDGDPLDIDITISNKSSDVASSIEDLAHRTAITAQYAQGATNLYSQQFADNADTEHPATMRFYVPTSCAKINQVLLSWKLEKFRAYETGAGAGGATVTTTESGGSETITKEQTLLTTNAATGEVITSAGYPNGCTGGAVSSSGSGAASTTSSAGGGNTSEVQVVVDYAGSHSHSMSDHSHGMGHFHHGPAHSHGIDAHRHTGPSHRHSFSGSDSVANGHYHSISSPGSSTVTGGVSTNATHSISISGNTGYAGTGDTSSTSLETNFAGAGMTGNALTSDGSSRTQTSSDGGGSTGSAGNHYHTTYAHYHSMSDHTHTMPHVHQYDHTHNVAVAYTIPAMSFNIPSHRHSLTLGNHQHPIVYGIYEGTQASSVTVKVDGEEIPADELSADEMDIVEYLSKDGNGKITRGTWHTVEVIPNTLSRIEANLFVQTFVTSYSGGNY